MRATGKGIEISEFQPFAKIQTINAPPQADRIDHHRREII